MNWIIKEQLEKVRAQMSEYNNDSTLIHIYKSDTDVPANDFIVGKTYRILIADYIINEPENFTLSSNWNKGVIPTSKCLNALVTKIAGNMIQFNCVGFNQDLNQIKEDTYIGLWLPKKAITILGVYQ